MFLIKKKFFTIHLSRIIRQKIMSESELSNALQKIEKLEQTVADLREDIYNLIYLRLNDLVDHVNNNRYCHHDNSYGGYSDYGFSLGRHQFSETLEEQNEENLRIQKLEEEEAAAAIVQAEINRRKAEKQAEINKKRLATRAKNKAEKAKLAENAKMTDS